MDNARLTVQCMPPTYYAFDIDIYDCPCGHIYGNHDYKWLDPEGIMIIAGCTVCCHEESK